VSPQLSNVRAELGSVPFVLLDPDSAHLQIVVLSVECRELDQEPLELHFEIMS
jgi:hypothetical protein